MFQKTTFPLTYGSDAAPVDCFCFTCCDSALLLLLEDELDDDEDDDELDELPLSLLLGL